MCRLITPVASFTPYWLDLAASDLTRPAPSDWSKLATTSPVEWTGTVPPDQSLSCSIVKNSTEREYMFTATGVPGVNGANGDYQLILRMLVGNSNVKLSFQVHRVNSSGTVQASSSTTAEQLSSAGPILLFSLASVNLGTWAAGDRIRVDIIAHNIKTSGSAITITFALGRRQTVANHHQLVMSVEAAVLSSQVIA